MARWTGERAGEAQPAELAATARSALVASFVGAVVLTGAARARRTADARLPGLPSSPQPRTIPPCDGSGVRIASNAVASPQRHVQHVGEDRAPDAVDGLLQKRESLALAF
jgi:hypothetical protein